MKRPHRGPGSPLGCVRSRADRPRRAPCHSHLGGRAILALVAKPPPTEPRKQPRQARSRALVEAVLDATERVLAQEGPERASTTRIAEVAGVSVGSLYQYFPHKDALVAELIERRADAERAFMQRWIEGLAVDDLESALEGIVRGVLAFRATDPALHRALLQQLPHIGRFDELRRRVEVAAQGLVLLLERFRAQLPDGDVALARFVLVNAIHSLTHDGVLPPPASVDDERLAQAIMRLVRGYLRAPSQG